MRKLFAVALGTLLFSGFAFGQDLKVATVIPATVTTSAPLTVKPCLIVTSAEGHRFRNSMIAGALTGGIGLLAGGVFGGAKFEYRDGFNLSPGDVKMKYKGKELQKLQLKGTHIEVISAKDKTGTELKDARTACHE